MSTNISCVGSGRRAWRCTITLCWRTKAPRWDSEASKMRMESRSSWLVCQKICLLESENYTLLRIWDAMTIYNTQSYSWVKASSNAWDGWCGRQPMASITFMPPSIALKTRYHRNASIPKCALWTGSRRDGYGEILEDNSMLIDVQLTLRLGDTLGPLIFIFNGTHLPNFARDMQERPVYKTIVNLSSKIHQMPSMHSILMVALLPILIKHHKIPQWKLDEQRETNWEVLNQVLLQVLQPLTFKQNPSAQSGYYNVLSADGNSRHCKRVLAAWLADCAEYSYLHHLEQHVSLWCKCPNNKPGGNVTPDNEQTQHTQNLHRTLSDENTKSADTEHWFRHVRWGFNMLWHILCIVSDLLKLDLLLSLQISMLDNLQIWILHFLNMYKWLYMFNAILLSLPAYHDLTPEYISYEDIVQWTGKAINEMNQYLLGVLTQSQGGSSPAQHPIFNCAIECTRALLEFNISA